MNASAILIVGLRAFGGDCGGWKDSLRVRRRGLGSLCVGEGGGRGGCRPSPSLNRGRKRALRLMRWRKGIRARIVSTQRKIHVGETNKRTVKRLMVYFYRLTRVESRMRSVSIRTSSDRTWPDVFGKGNRGRKSELGNAIVINNPA